MKTSRAVMVIGPNGVGKTKVAYGLARRVGGDIVNLDRTYLYRHFPLTTGMEDALKEQGVRRHLYQVLDPAEPSWSSSTFCETVLSVCAAIQNEGRAVIAEGASTVYVPDLLRLNRDRSIFDRIVGLRFPDGVDIANRYRARVDQAIEEGLLDEIRRNLPRYADSFIMRECHFAVPLIDHLRGRFDLDEAKRVIVDRCLAYKDRQLELFTEFPEIQWVDVDDPERALRCLVSS